MSSYDPLLNPNPGGEKKAKESGQTKTDAATSKKKRTTTNSFEKKKSF